MIIGFVRSGNGLRFAATDFSTCKVDASWRRPFRVAGASTSRSSVTDSLAHHTHRDCRSCYTNTAVYELCAAHPDLIAAFLEPD